MNQLLLHIVVIGIAMFFLKLLMDMIFKFLASAFGALAKSSSKITVIGGIVLIALAYSYPAHTANILTGITGFIQTIIQ